MRRVEAFRWLYFDRSANVLRLTRQHMTREEAAMRLPEAKHDLETREVPYVKEPSDETGTGCAQHQWFDAKSKRFLRTLSSSPDQ